MTIARMRTAMCLDCTTGEVDHLPSPRAECLQRYADEGDSKEAKSWLLEDVAVVVVEVAVVEADN